MLVQKIVAKDDVLIDEYAKMPESSEQIIRDQSLSIELLSKVNKRLSKSQQFDDTELKHRLETLRKSAKLPKKFRNYNGRNLDLIKRKPK